MKARIAVIYNTKLHKEYNTISTEVKVTYQGNLSCKAYHPASESDFPTAAPTAIGGTGKGFTPGDVLAASLGSCMLTYIGVIAMREELSIEGTVATVETEMGDNPHRVSNLKVSLLMPDSCKNLTAAQKAKLVNGSKMCPVKASLHPDIKIDIEFIWPAD